MHCNGRKLPMYLKTANNFRNTFFTINNKKVDVQNVDLPGRVEETCAQYEFATAPTENVHLKIITWYVYA